MADNRRKRGQKASVEGVKRRWQTRNSNSGKMFLLPAWLGVFDRKGAGELSLVWLPMIASPQSGRNEICGVVHVKHVLLGVIGIKSENVRQKFFLAFVGWMLKQKQTVDDEM